MPGRLPFEGASNSIEYDVGRPGPVRSSVAGSGENTASVRRAEDIPMERLEAVGQRHGSPAILRKSDSDHEGRMEEFKSQKLGNMPKTAAEVNFMLKHANNFLNAAFGHSPSRPRVSQSAPPPAATSDTMRRAAERALALEQGYGGRQRSYSERLTDATGLSSAAAALRGFSEADKDVLAAEPNPLRRLALRAFSAKAALRGSQSRAAVDRDAERGLRDERRNAIGRHGVLSGVTARAAELPVPPPAAGGVSGIIINPGDVIRAQSGPNEVLIRRSTGQPVLRDSRGNFYSPLPGTLEHNVALSAMEGLSPSDVHSIKASMGQREDSGLNRAIAALATLQNDPKFHAVSTLGPIALSMIPAGDGRTAADTKLGKMFQYGLLGTQIASMLSGATTRNSGSGLGRNFTSGTSGI